MISDHIAQQCTDGTYLFGSNRCARRHAQHTSASAFCLWQAMFAFRIQGTVGLHPMTAGVKIPTHENPFCPEQSVQHIPAHASFLIDLNDDILKVISLVLFVTY